MWRILCAVESGVDIVREGVRGCVTIRQLRTIQIKSLSQLLKDRSFYTICLQ